MTQLPLQIFNTTYLLLNIATNNLAPRNEDASITTATMTENLRTASLYINNQLLSRGLLRDGETIDFTNPSAGQGGTTATMGRVIAIVNDLILRRDVCTLGCLFQPAST